VSGRKTMTESGGIADELRRAFYGEAWHGDSLMEVLRGVTAAQAAAKPIKSAHSIWELVLHISAWDGTARRRMTGAVVALTGDGNFPPVVDSSESSWKRTIEQVRRVHDDLVDEVSKLPEARLAEQVPGKEGAHYNFAYMLHGLAQHAAYHAGQIALLKKM
jgi:uncharacterized damage-inducible protein DinB